MKLYRYEMNRASITPKHWIVPDKSHCFSLGYILLNILKRGLFKIKINTIQLCGYLKSKGIGNNSWFWQQNLDGPEVTRQNLIGSKLSPNLGLIF